MFITDAQMELNMKKNKANKKSTCPDDLIQYRVVSLYRDL